MMLDFMLKKLKILVALLVFSVIYTLIIIIFRDIPMFWDMSYISQISNLIYDNHFTSFIFSVTDNGATPIYSIYLASLWAVFGKSLLVSHLAILPFVIGMLYQLYKLAERFIEKKYFYILFLILLIEPTIATQTIIAGYDIVYCYLFLLGLNSIFDNKRFLIALSVIFMPLLNLRGFSLVIALFIIDWYINYHKYKNIKKLAFSTIAYLPSILLLIFWLLYHYKLTGWFAISGNREKYHNINGLERMLRNIIYISWKIADFGRVLLFLFIFLIFLKNKKTKDNKGKTLFYIIILTVIPYIIFFLPFSYPVSHRHFMVIYVISVLAFVYFVSILKKKSLRNVLFTLTIISLLSGNFILYPERFGNGWDSSLKVLPYFKMKKEFDDYLKRSGISPSLIGTKFPMDFDNYDCYLNNNHYVFASLDTITFNKISYVTQSNISNTFTPDEINELNNNWILIKEIRSWPVYIKLFKNPEK